MKKKIFMIVTLISVLVICSVVYAASINKTSISIYEGKGYTLKLSGTKIRSVSTGNKKVATISKTGYVKGIKAGTTTVSVKGTNGKTYKCTVKVVAPYINKTSISIYEGNNYVLKLSGTTIKSVTTANKKVATISKAGSVTGIKAGSTTVSLKGTNGKTYKCTVKVMAPTLNSSKISIGETKKFQLSLKGATIKDAKSENKEIATVTSKGLVKGIKKGDTIITVIDTYNNEYKCNVNIDDVYLEEDFVEMFEGLKYIWGYSVKEYQDPGYMNVTYYYPKLHGAEITKITSHNDVIIKQNGIIPGYEKRVYDVTVHASNNKQYKMQIASVDPDIKWGALSVTPNSIIQIKLKGHGVNVKEAENVTYKVSDTSIGKIFKKNNRWYVKALKTGTIWITCKYHGKTIQTKMNITKPNLVKGCNHDIKLDHKRLPEDYYGETYIYKCSKCKKYAYCRQDLGKDMLPSKIKDGYYVTY